jgi:hypothetical protein
MPRITSPDTQAKHQQMVQQNFAAVLTMVQQGWHIYQALKKLKINRTVFYKNITPLQHQQLQHARTQHVIYGAAFASNRT